MFQVTFVSQLDHSLPLFLTCLFFSLGPSLSWTILTSIFSLFFYTRLVVLFVLFNLKTLKPIQKDIWLKKKKKKHLLIKLAIICEHDHYYFWIHTILAVLSCIDFLKFPKNFWQIYTKYVTSCCIFLNNIKMQISFSEYNVTFSFVVMFLLDFSAKFMILFAHTMSCISKCIFDITEFIAILVQLPYVSKIVT